MTASAGEKDYTKCCAHTHPAEVDGVVDDAVDLRDAAERVAVLHAAAVAVRLGDLRRVSLVVQQASQQLCNELLAGVRARLKGMRKMGCEK